MGRGSGVSSLSVCEHRAARFRVLLPEVKFCKAGARNGRSHAEMRQCGTALYRNRAVIFRILQPGLMARHELGAAFDPCQSAHLILLISYTGLGSGFFLYLAMLALTMSRFIVGSPLPGQLLPTVWINLGPIGVVPMSLAGLVDASPFLSVREPFYVLALLLWGFGAWWLTMSIILTLGYRRRGELPFSLAWWAFTFPLGAYAAASSYLGTLLHMDSVWLLGLAAYALLVVLWSATFLNTAQGVFAGTLFAPPPHVPQAASPKPSP